MKIKLTDFINKKAQVNVAYRGDDISVTFATEKITPAYRAQLQKLAQEESNGAADDPDVRLLGDLLTDWDIVGDNDEPLPPTVENLRRLSYSFLATVARAILEDIANPPTGKAR